MPIPVHQHEFDARRRLTELGISVEALQLAINAGQVARRTCTDNDPPFIPGTEAWRFVVRTLREQLLPLGWRKIDPGNYSLVVNEKRNINIVVATGDKFTRVYPGTPKTRSLKGLYTEAAIVRNKVEGDLFPETLTDEVRIAATILGRPTWILLIHITDEECRAELSYPDQIEEKQITSWSERIFIPEDPKDPGSAEQPDDDFGPDFDVPVKRKL